MVMRGEIIIDLVVLISELKHFQERPTNSFLNEINVLVQKTISHSFQNNSYIYSLVIKLT